MNSKENLNCFSFFLGIGKFNAEYELIISKELGDWS